MIPFIKKWNELISIPLALILWWLSPYILHAVDETSATYDYGVFQIPLFAIISLLLFNGVAWLILKLNFPELYKYLDDSLDTKELTVWQRILLSIFIFSLYLSSLVLLSRTL